MAEFVLDASVALSWCFPGDPTEDTPYSRLILAKLAKDDAIVPDIWAFELANTRTGVGQCPMYFDEVSVKFHEHPRDPFTVSIEFTRTEDDWRLARTGSYDFPHGSEAQGEKA
jgi:hypothetical protein